MNEMEANTEALAEVESRAITKPEPVVNGGQPPPDAKALRTSHVGQLLGQAYLGASTLKLTKNETDRLTADFPDQAVEIRPHDGIIYIPHMVLRERLWEVFGPGQVAEICRERFMRADTNEIAVDLVLMIRGVYATEAVGTAKFFANNPRTNFGDTVESAWSDGIRRCCKRFYVGTQVWRPQYVRDWLEKYAVKRGDKWFKRHPEEKPATEKPKGKSREYTLKSEPELPPVIPVEATDEHEPDDIPF